jgi:hypothetical protein
MTATFGSGDYTYRVVDGWAKWPEDWQLSDVAGIGVDIISIGHSGSTATFKATSAG